MTDHESSARFAGRLSAFLYGLSGALVIVSALVLPRPPGADLEGLLTVGGLALACGVLIGLLPWSRWPRWASMFLLPPTFALVALNNYYQGVDGYRYATYFFVTFAWIGLTQRRWTSVAFVPLAAAAYLVPLEVAGEATALTTSSALYVLPACVLLGEAVAWVSERLSYSQAAVRASERSMRQLFAENPQPMWVHSRRTQRFLEVNAAAVEEYGYSRIDFLQMRIDDLAVDGDPVVPANGDASMNARHRIKTGRVLDVDVTTHQLHFEGQAAVLVAVQDVTERNRLEGQLRHRAFHDPLTQLANRALFADRIDHAMARLARDERSLAVVVLDLDGFKNINDSLGHTAGDQLLVAAAQRLRNQLRPGDTGARLGGDEFAILLEDVSELEEATALADRLREVFSEPFAIASKNLLVTASVGVALNRPGEGTEELVRNADMAMYRAKADGKSRVCVYEPAMHDAAMARLDLEAELRRALHHSQFVLHYQPTIRLETGEVSGFEALVRWEHPDRGLLPPVEFVPLAEETGLIVEVGRWVLSEACTRASEWQADHPDLCPGIAVNLSPRQLLDSRLTDDVANVLHASGLDPASLTLEITESGILADRRGSLARLRRLKELGVRVALDDFGTGYSSLSRLRELPIDLLKIDKAFIDGVADDRQSTGLVQAILRMAQTLSLETIAEGVETADQAEQLRELGSEYVQGFLFSRPLPPEQVGPFLRDARARAVASTQPGGEVHR